MRATPAPPPVSPLNHSHVDPVYGAPGSKEEDDIYEELVRRDKERTEKELFGEEENMGGGERRPCGYRGYRE